MYKKRIIIGIALVLVLVLLCGIQLIYKNYQFGQDLHNYVNDMYVQCVLLADGIELLEEDFAKLGPEHSSFGSRTLFDNALSSTQAAFGTLNMPILEDVRQEYIDQFGTLYRELLNDPGDVKLIALFTDPEKAGELAVLKERMHNMAECFREFTKSFHQMSEWEQCFYSWEKERQILSEKVRMP